MVGLNGLKATYNDQLKLISSVFRWTYSTTTVTKGRNLLFWQYNCFVLNNNKPFPNFNFF